MLRYVPALLLAAVLSACKTVEVREDGTVVAPEAVKATWDRGLLFMGRSNDCYYSNLGDALTRERCLAGGPPEATGPVPAVVFLHGCTGWGGRQERVMRTIHRNGYVVFAPDSFARPGRVALCGKGGRWEKATLRLDEAAYALAKVRQLPWVDPQKLVLAGFSEGGMAVAEYPDDDVRAILILGWGCRGGIRAPGSVPVLNVVGERDSIHESSTGNTLCSMLGRSDSKAVHVDASHDIAQDSATTGIVGDFLARALAR